MSERPTFEEVVINRLFPQLLDIEFAQAKVIRARKRIREIRDMDRVSQVGHDEITRELVQIDHILDDLEIKIGNAITDLYSHQQRAKELAEYWHSKRKGGRR